MNFFTTFSLARTFCWFSLHPTPITFIMTVPNVKSYYPLTERGPLILTGPENCLRIKKESL